MHNGELSCVKVSLLRGSEKADILSKIQRLVLVEFWAGPMTTHWPQISADMPWSLNAWGLFFFQCRPLVFCEFVVFLEPIEGLIDYSTAMSSFHCMVTDRPIFCSVKATNRTQLALKETIEITQIVEWLSRSHGRKRDTHCPKTEWVPCFQRWNQAQHNWANCKRTFCSGRSNLQ